MIKLPVSAQFLALTLTAAILALVHPLNTFAGSDNSDRSAMCEKALAQISASFSNHAVTFSGSSSNQALTKTEGTGTVQDVILSPRAADQTIKAEQNFFVIQHKKQVIQRMARTRLDALLVLHRAIFAPALAYVDIGGKESPDVVARLERIDLADYPTTTADHIYIIDPAQPNIADVVAISTRADNTFTLQLLLEQKIRPLPLLAELDSMIFLAARKLKLGMTLKKMENAKYDLRTFVVHGHRSTEALPQDFKLSASDVVAMHRIRDERTGEENLRVIINDPIEPFNSVGQARYVQLESSNLDEALKLLEALLEQKSLRLKLEASFDTEGTTVHRFSL